MIPEPDVIDPTSNQPRDDDHGNEEPRRDASSEPTVEIPANEAEMTKLRDERDQLEQQLQRSMADTANIRRRQKQEMDDSRRRVLEDAAGRGVRGVILEAGVEHAFDAGAAVEPAGERLDLRGALARLLGTGARH